MTNYDYFIQTNQMLLEGKRFKEQIELCEYAISSAVWPKAMKRQCEALCRWTLAETYFYVVGDAKKARESYIAFLRFVDNNRSMITDAPSLREVMEDMYVKACTDMGQLAISYDEYSYYMHKIESTRPLTQKQKEQKDAMEYNRQHGMSWCDNILQLAELERRSIESGSVNRLPCGIAIYSLFLIYPETEASIDVLRAAINNYSAFVCRLVGESILHCAAKRHPANPDNYRFIIEQAIELVGEFLNDMETHDVARESQKKLTEAKSESIDKSNFYNYGYNSTAPSGVQDFIPPLVLKEQIKQYLKDPGVMPVPKPGCAVTLLISILSAGGIIAVGSMIL